jgi:hypothetical protein
MLRRYQLRIMARSYNVPMSMEYMQHPACRFCSTDGDKIAAGVVLILQLLFFPPHVSRCQGRREGPAAVAAQAL